MGLNTYSWNELRVEKHNFVIYITSLIAIALSLSLQKKPNASTFYLSNMKKVEV